MFGVSFPELMLIGAVALIIVGPQRLPGMLGTLGKWSNKLRRMLFDVRQQSGIDDILRAEGISGGLKEIRDLRNAVRGNVTGLLTSGTAPTRQGVQQLVNQAKPTAAAGGTAVQEQVTDPYADVAYDRTREYPDEGCDAYGAIPDDLWAASHPEPQSTPTGRVASKVPEPAAEVTVPLAGPELAVAVAAVAAVTESADATSEESPTVEPVQEEPAQRALGHASPDSTEVGTPDAVSTDNDPTAS